MDAFEALLTRRSIRKYAQGDVPEEAVRRILEAAMSAPSAANQQPWEFIVMRERALLDAVPRHHPHSGMILEAPMAILVCGNLERETRQGYWVQDCAAATENLLLALHALGFGGVWLGVYPREERVKGLSALMGLPHHVIPFSLVPVGRPGEKKGRAERFDASRIHFDRW
jgi:nitroreductase